MARDDSPFPRVSLVAKNQPYAHPQYIPGTANRLPPEANRPRPPTAPLVDEFSDSGLITTDLTALENPRGTIDDQKRAMDSADVTIIRDPFHYADVVELVAYAADNSLGQQSQKFLDAPVGRRNFLAFRNNSAAANLFIGFGNVATVNSMFRLIPGQMILLDTSVPQSDLYLLADAAGGILLYQYSNIVERR